MAAPSSTFSVLASSHQRNAPSAPKVSQSQTSAPIDSVGGSRGFWRRASRRGRRSCWFAGSTASAAASSTRGGGSFAQVNRISSTRLLSLRRGRPHDCHQNPARGPPARRGKPPASHRLDHWQRSIPIGRDPRSAASFNQASVQSRVPVLLCRLCPDAGSRRTLNHFPE